MNNEGCYPEEMNQEGTEHGIHLLIPDGEAVHTVGCLSEMFELLDAEWLIICIFSKLLNS